MALLRVGQPGPRRTKAAFDEDSEGYARGGAFVGHGGHRAFIEWKGRVNSRIGDLDVGWLTFDSDPMAPEARCHSPGRPGPEKGIENHVTWLGAGKQYPIEQSLGLLRRMSFRAIVVLDPLGAAADRKHPVGAHLKVVVEGLHRAIVERVARLLVLRAPQQGFVRVGETRSAKVRHRVRLAPDDVVQDPELGILEERADTVDVVIAADYPDCAIVLEDAARLIQPFAGEIVVGGKTVELVPLVVDRIHSSALGPKQVAAQLQIIGRVREDHVDTFVGKPRHFGDAVALEDGVERKLARLAPLRASESLRVLNSSKQVHR